MSPLDIATRRALVQIYDIFQRLSSHEPMPLFHV
jgi:hypothetical protein